MKVDPLTQRFMDYVNSVMDNPKLLKDRIGVLKAQNMAFFATLNAKWLKVYANEKMLKGCAEHGDKMLRPDYTPDMIDKEISNEYLDLFLYSLMQEFKKNDREKI